jgi:cytoskeletal protein CcmA (bactofilin family)
MKTGFTNPFGKENSMRDPMGQEDISGFLAEGTEIKGEIRFRDLLRVDGKVSGKIVSEGELVVGEQGSVEAEVSVGTLSVSGKVTGTIHAAEKVEIHPKGKVHGDMTIAKPNLVIHEGGVFEGKIDMAGMGAGASRPEGKTKDHDDEDRVVEPFRR